MMVSVISVVIFPSASLNVIYPVLVPSLDGRVTATEGVQAVQLVGLADVP